MFCVYNYFDLKGHAYYREIRLGFCSFLLDLQGVSLIVMPLYRLNCIYNSFYLGLIYVFM